MRLGHKVLVLLALVIAAGLSLAGARLAADAIETRSLQAVKTALIEAGHDWAEVHTDGLQVHIGGEAPTEARRFNALSVSGRMVDSARVIDGTTVTPAKPLAPPRFIIEVLRNEDGISLIGLIPASIDPDELAAEIATATGGSKVTDFLETAAYPVPAGWVEALEYGLEALSKLPRSKVSIGAGTISVTAISGSPSEKRELETALSRRVPDGVRLSLAISAPRPVITPFTLRMRIDETGPRFDACSADNEAGRARILAAARAIGLEGQAPCTLALGVPTPDWPIAVEMAIAALGEIGKGTLTFSDADIALVAAPDTAQETFDRVVGELESNLPDVFSLTSVLTDPPEEISVNAPPPPEFTATRSPEGQVQLRGRLPNAVVHDMIESFARARFGVENVYMAARLDESLPEDWPVRVLAGLRALSMLENGMVTVLADHLALSGVTGNAEAQSEIAGIFAQKLGETASFDLRVSYDKSLDPLADLPTPQDCLDRINAIQAEQKITFEPGSVTVEGESSRIVDRIADVLRACREVDMTIEIAGHTDSQGRESMNLDLSEKRANAVLEALAERRVLISKMSARGYGESSPIADNDNEDGREANRRIEFRLLDTDGQPLADAETPTGGDAPDETTDSDQTDPDTTAESGEEAAE